MPFRIVQIPDRTWHTKRCETFRRRTLESEHLCENMNPGSRLTFFNQTVGIQDLHAPSYRRK